MPLFVQDEYVINAISVVNTKMSRFVRLFLFLIWFGFGLGSPGVASAQSSLDTALDLNLNQALLIALSKNPTLQGVYLGRVVDEAKLRLAETHFQPRASIVFSAQEQRYDDYVQTATVEPRSSLNLPLGGQAELNWRIERSHINRAGMNNINHDANSTVTLDFSLPLLRGGGLSIGRAPVDLARLNEKLNILQLKLQITNVVDEVIRAYRTLLLEKRRIKLEEFGLKRTHRQLEQNETLVERGRLAAKDLVFTRNSLARQEVSLAQSRERLNQVQLTLIQLLGLGANETVRPIDEIDLNRIGTLYSRPPNLTQATKLALSQRASYQQALVGEDIARLERMLAKDANRWELNISGSLMVMGDDSHSTTQAIRTGFSEVPGHSLGVQLRIPWGNDRTRQQRLGSANVAVRQSLLRSQAQRSLIETEVEQSLNSLNSQWQQLELAEQSLELAQQSLEVEEEKLLVGRSSVFEVNSFEEQLRQAEQSLLEAAINYQNAWSNFDRVTGTTLRHWDLAIPAVLQ